MLLSFYGNRLSWLIGSPHAGEAREGVSGAADAEINWYDSGWAFIQFSAIPKGAWALELECNEEVFTGEQSHRLLKLL